MASRGTRAGERACGRVYSASWGGKAEHGQGRTGKGRPCRPAGERRRRSLRAREERADTCAVIPFGSNPRGSTTTRADTADGFPDRQGVSRPAEGWTPRASHGPTRDDLGARWNSTAAGGKQRPAAWAPWSLASCAIDGLVSGEVRADSATRQYAATTRDRSEAFTDLLRPRAD